MSKLWRRKQLTENRDEKHFFEKHVFQDFSVICRTDVVLDISNIPSELVVEAGMAAFDHSKSLLHGEPGPSEHGIELQLITANLGVFSVWGDDGIVVGVPIVRCK